MDNSSSDDMYNSNSDDDLDVGDDFIDYDEGKQDQTPRNYTILRISDIKIRQDEAIFQVSTVLSLSKAESCILLRNYNWDVAKVQEQWFGNENRVRIAVGLPVAVPETTQIELTCGICSDVYPRDGMAAVACGAHWYCAVCWMGYLQSAIHDGAGCLGLRCPGPCTAAVSSDMINNFALDDERDRYAYFLLRSYVDDNPKIKWCPSPGCEFAVELSSDHEGFDVQCECLHSFCWNCAEESHIPVDCKTAGEWRRDMPEAMSVQWIFSNTKPCPKCGRPIEKVDGGCPHMRCIVPCGHNFCWNCLGDWYINHNDFGRCKLVHDNAAAEINDTVLRRYTHYYDLWASNNKLRNEVFDYLLSPKWAERMGLIESKLFGFEFGALEPRKFIREAWEQIINCRQVLQWTYVYDYYLQVYKRNKKDYFNYTQGLAEGILEQLHQCVEEEGKTYFDARGSMVGFKEYRLRLISLTFTARNRFNNLFRELEISDIGREPPVAQKKRKFSDEEAPTSSRIRD